MPKGPKDEKRHVSEGDDAFWTRFLALTEEYKDKPADALLADVEELMNRIIEHRRQQAIGLDRMRAIVAEVQELARSGKCDESVAIDFLERLHATETALTESHDNLNRLGRLVGRVAKEPESSN